MNIVEAAQLARNLMDQHGLTDWEFEFDRAKRRFGRASHSKKVISLSAPIVARNSEENVLETIRHEIAHALIDPSHGHDATWYNMALSVGSNGKVTYDAKEVDAPEGKWIGVCELGHRTRPRHRRGNFVCKKDRTPITWIENKKT